jgi:mannose-6-phosphate isomerase-like protein (cupin superfamily)
VDICDITRYRGEFFRVLQKTPRSQAAVMTIAAGEDAGPEETHRADQIIYIVEGEGILRVSGEERRVSAGTLAVIPAGAAHHVSNPGRAPLFLVTVYAPPEY